MKKPQIIPMYLPQFHKIPENDQWWGEGFTEWTNVRKAKPLFDGHIQPRIPINNHYYDLMDPDTLINQMKLAQDYCIDGFCFYHYWFKDGKKLLEKPIERMLETKNLPVKFCLCWANEPWTRNWDGQEGSKVTLMEQEYGYESEWEKHFEYLSQFFSRPEYIRRDGRPVFLIYRPSDIPNLSQMILKWKELAHESNLNELFIIGVHRRAVVSEYPYLCDGVMDFEPFATLSSMTNDERESAMILKEGYNQKEYKVYDYSRIGAVSANKFKMKGINHYLGCFPGWDNTPRRGEDETVLKIVGNSVEAFREYFRKQYERSMDNDFIFINAWNEWGEGAFLEPDEYNKYGLLEAIKETVYLYEDLYGKKYH